MEISAVVVDEPGINPYWLTSITFNRAGLSSCSITMLSATLDKVWKIGQRSLLKSVILGDLGREGTSASFQTLGSLHSLKDVFKISATGATKSSACSLRTQFGNPSGPLAQDVFIFLSLVITHSPVTDIILI